MDFTTKIKNKLIAIFVATSLIFVYSCEGFAYANEVLDKQSSFEEQQTQVIDEAVSNNSVDSGTINEDVYETKDAVVADGYYSEITIPKNGSDAIELSDGEGGKFTMSLSQEAQSTEGVLADNGTVMYDCDNDVSIAVQPLIEDFGDEQIESVRTLITIANEDAPHKYDFDIEVNKDQHLVLAKDFFSDELNAGSEQEVDTGEAYVVNKDNEIQYIIDPAWAKDANGEDIDTHYEVSGNTLTQVVDFDENSAFPIVADPTAKQVGKCVLFIGAVLGATIFAVAKLAKVAKWIKNSGGVSKAAKRIIKEFSKAKKKGGNWFKKVNWEKIGSGMKTIFLDFVGVYAIRNACSW